MGSLVLDTLRDPFGAHFGSHLGSLMWGDVPHHIFLVTLHEGGVESAKGIRGLWGYLELVVRRSASEFQDIDISPSKA